MISDAMRRIPLEDHYEGSTYVDMVTIHSAPHRHALLLHLHRAYKGCAERVDTFSGKAGWVKFRRALNQPTGANEYE